MKVKSEVYTATRQQLANVQLPAQTRTYKPVSHSQIIDLTLEGIEKAGFSVSRELYTWAKDGDVATGRYFIKGVEDAEMQLQACWQNSYNKSLPLIFSLSANILVCTNGMIAARNVNSFRKKHQGEIQIFTPDAIPEYIKRGGEMFMGLQNDREKMKQIETSKRLVAELLGRIYFEEQLIESTQLNIIKRELENPTHNYGSPDSLWSLYQHVTFAIGGIHPSHWMQDHIDAHTFFSNVANSPQEDDYTEYEEEVYNEFRHIGV
jgi:hypothetical protein